MSFLQSSTYCHRPEPRAKDGNTESRAGQTMILTVLVLSGTLLSITLTGGLIMLYQIRDAGNFANTTKAVFAADSGINWWYYYKYSPLYASSTNSSATINGLLNSNGANFSILEGSEGTKVTGQAGSSKRAFLIQPLPAASSTCAPDIMLAAESNRKLALLADYKSTLGSFIDDINASSSETYLGLKEFGTLGVTGTILRHVTSTITSSSTLKSGINNLSSAGASVNLADAILISQDELDSAPSLGHPPNHERDDTTYPDFIILIVSDGFTNPIRPMPNPLLAAENVATLAKASGTTIFVVGSTIKNAAYKTSLKNIASPSGYFDALDYTNDLENVLINQVLPKILVGC